MQQPLPSDSSTARVATVPQWVIVVVLGWYWYWANSPISKGKNSQKRSLFELSFIALFQKNAHSPAATCAQLAGVLSILCTVAVEEQDLSISTLHTKPYKPVGSNRMFVSHWSISPRKPSSPITSTLLGWRKARRRLVSAGALAKSSLNQQNISKKWRAAVVHDSIFVSTRYTRISMQVRSCHKN